MTLRVVGSEQQGIVRGPLTLAESAWALARAGLGPSAPSDSIMTGVLDRGYGNKSLRIR